MIKHIMIALVIVIGLSGVSSATTTYGGSWCNGDGEGVYSFSFPTEGYHRFYAYTGMNHSLYNDGRPFYYKFYLKTNNASSCIRVEKCSVYDTCMAYQCPGTACTHKGSTSYSGSGHCDGHSNTNSAMISALLSNYYGDPAGTFTGAFVISWTSFDESYIMGNVSCVTDTDLKIWNGSNYVIIDSTTDSEYEFKVIDDQTYQLVFHPSLDGYVFTTSGSNITYNYDDCKHTTYRFEESCGDLIPDSEGYYCEYLPSGISCKWFDAPSGILDISNSSATAIEVYTHTFIGETGWIIDPIVSGTTYTLQNPNIAWGLKVIVQNESDGMLIDGAMVKVNQDCYCTSGYSTRQKLTVNGMVSFGDMSLQDASLFVMASGYKILDENNTGYSAFLSGRSNFSSKTWVVKLAPSWSENESTFYESNNTVNIFFVNENGNRTSKILDTDLEVYLYYENNNTDEEDMTLRFESSSTHSYFIPELSWNIPYGEIGHKTIPQANFTPYDYSYRAVIYNSSIYGWNMTIPLTVRNATKEENQHYENLSTDLWFMYADAGKIDYRNDLDIGVHACSNNTTLMNIDIELYKDNVLLCYKNMTPSNFINADFPYYYIWSPTYTYESGSNYSVRMYGFDRTLLETDYVDCYTDDVTRKNKLTIIVKNQYGTNLEDVFVYLEDYGSIPTGSNYYASFEGLSNGYYRYKATKPNYAETGWDDITLSDSDEIVTYVLTATDTEAGSATQPQKMDENELQNIYLIIMAFLLIFIIIGGLKYAL